MSPAEVTKMAARSYFLLSNGWKYDEYDDSWQKPGVSRKIYRRCRCGGCQKEEVVEDFDMESAYHHELSTQEVITGVMET